jgi:hypothetical protein
VADLHTHQQKSSDKGRVSTKPEMNATLEIQPVTLTDSSTNALRLQRTIGNRQTIQHLCPNQQANEPATTKKPPFVTPLVSSAPQRKASIQRLMTERAILMNAGDPTNDAILNNITTAVAEYHEATADGAGVETLVSYLNIIVTFVQRWLDSNPVEDGHDHNKARTAKILPNLMRGAQREKEALEKGDQKTIDKSDKTLINKQDIRYEMLAHYAAYKGIDGAMSELLTKWGFESAFRRTVQGNGFFVGLLMPQQNRTDVAPVLTFKGTTQTSTGDISSDLDPVAVGFTTFQRHKSEVAGLIDEAGSKVDVVGHSLGGALAQHCAFSFNSNIRRVVTFQAAAISGTQALMYKGMKDKPTDVTHHVAKGDLVPMGGTAHLKGQGFLHDTGKSAMGAHTTYLFTAPEFREDREAAGLTDEVLAKLGLDKHLRNETHSQVKHTKGHPLGFLKHIGGEMGRQFGAALVGIPLFIASMFQKYPSIPMQDSTVKNNAKHAAVTVFKEYKQDAEKKRLFGLRKAKGITLSGIEDAVAKIAKQDPAFGKFAGAARGIEEAAVEVLGIQSIKIEGTKVISVSL